MAERPKFQEQQYAFAAHIRDPKNAPAPEGIEDRRMAIYRELFFNNLESLLSNMFPVLNRIHSDEHWQKLVRGFMQGHQAKTPYFLQLPAVRAHDLDFKNMIDAKGNPVHEEILTSRQRMLEGAVLAIKPDCLITELFPFGRRALQKEFMALIECAKNLTPKPLISDL